MVKIALSLSQMKIFLTFTMKIRLLRMIMNELAISTQKQSIRDKLASPTKIFRNQKLIFSPSHAYLISMY